MATIVQAIGQLTDQPVSMNTPLSSLQFDFVDYAYLQSILVRNYGVANTFINFEVMTVGDLLSLPL